MVRARGFCGGSKLLLGGLNEKRNKKIRETYVEISRKRLRLYMVMREVGKEMMMMGWLSPVKRWICSGSFGCMSRGLTRFALWVCKWMMRITKDD